VALSFAPAARNILARAIELPGQNVQARRLAESPNLAYNAGMPELAEVEYYRTRWNCGLGERIEGIALHPRKRIFRGVPVRRLAKLLPGTVLQGSESRGKQLLFCFSDGLWLGVHLGMTGKLAAAAPDFRPNKHDHLVLFQEKRTLVLSDSRLFGRVQFHHGDTPPEWWSQLPVPVDAPEFTREKMENFLRRHRKLSLKAALLLQAGFPGIGNWMADEILWRARIHPRLLCADLSKAQTATLWKEVRFVARAALKHVGTDFSDPPRGWLFHERWSKRGRCPIHAVALARATIGGRTTAWCQTCQGL
jgi:formamidopyrimidine-DNA glycosylase